MAKRQTPSNRIGTVGEAAFRLFATQQGLLPTKPEQDVGLDFVCHLDEDHKAKGSSNIAPALVGFAVRSTAIAGRRIRLSRDDAEFLLRMNDPVGLVLVDETTPTPAFYHRMVDEAFADELADFLSSDRASMSLTPERCRDANHFRRDVMTAMRPGEIERRRIAVARQRLGRRIDIGRLQVHRDEHGAITVVSALQLWDLFEQMDDDGREQLHRATFGAPELLQPRLAAMTLREELVAELSGLPEPYLIGGDVEFADSELRVEGPGGEARCSLRFTRNGAHWGYVHDAGFAITVSHRVQRGGRWVHELSAFADPDVALDLADHPDLWDFLAACVPGATVIDDTVEGRRFGVEQFAGLEAVGVFAASMQNASTLSGWTSGFAQLRDALDQETLASVQCLASTARAADGALDEVPLPSFYAEAPGSSRPELDAGRWKVPLVVNSARAGARVWLECLGDLILHNGGVVGVDTKEIVGATIEIVNQRLVKATTRPEFVFDSAMVAVVGEEGWEFPAPVEGRGPEGFVNLPRESSGTNV